MSTITFFFLFMSRFTPFTIFFNLFNHVLEAGNQRKTKEKVGKEFHKVLVLVLLISRLRNLSARLP